MSSAHNQISARSGGKRPMSKKKKIAVIASISAVAAVVIGVIVGVAVSNWDEYRQISADRKTVATCNGYEIPYEELRFVTLFYKDMLADKYGKDIWSDPAKAEEHRAELESLVKENLNENYVVLTTCESLSIPTESREMDEYVDDQMKILRDEIGSTKEYKAWLDEHWMTEHYLRFSIGVSYLESATYYTLLDNNLYAFRQDNIDEFKTYVETSDNYVRTIHVFIENVEGEDRDANFAEAKRISDSLRAVSDPEERFKLMTDYIGSSTNDDLYSVSGHGYYFTQGEMDEEYERASFGLDIWDVSEPVVCSGGNFIIMRLAPEADYIEKNAQTLLNNYHSVALGMYQDQYRKDCVVEFNEYGQSIDLVALN